MERLSDEYPEIPDKYLLDLLAHFLNHFKETSEPKTWRANALRHGDRSLLTMLSAFVPPNAQERCNYLTMTPSMLSELPAHRMLVARELSAKIKKLTAPPTFVSTFYKERFTIYGHRSPVYCLAFDKTNRRLFTGSDDFLVKVWCVRTGYLIYTIRGHNNVVTDIAINEENTLVATASSDGYVRVWTMDGYELVVSLRPNSSNVKPFTTVNFSPSPRPETRYLMATSEDGLVRLWKWDRDDLRFLDPESPIVFSCKFRARDRLRCSSFNYTGTKFAVAGDDGFVYVFSTVKVDTDDSGLVSDMGNASQEQDRPSGRGRRRVQSALFPDKSGQIPPQPVIPIANLEGHMGSITDLAYSHDGRRILSGCEDGTARIWSYDIKTKRWNSIVLDIKIEPTPGTQIVSPAEKNHLLQEDERQLSSIEASSGSEFGTYVPPLEIEHENMPDRLPITNALNGNMVPDSEEPKPPKVSMIAWTSDDSLCIVATSYGDIRVYNAFNGDLACVLKGHVGELYAVDSHPLNPNTILSAGYDGNVILWDLQRMTVIARRNHVGRVFLDCKFTKDGLKYAITDEDGKCTLFGIGGLDKDCKQVRTWQRGQYFATDYLVLRVDPDGTVIDDQTSLPPHMMPPTPIVDDRCIEYPNQKALGYGRQIPTHSDTFEVEDMKRTACYDLEEQAIQTAGVIVIPAVDRANIARRRRDFVKNDNEESGGATTPVATTFPLPPPILLELPDDSDDEDYNNEEGNGEGYNSSDSENLSRTGSDDFVAQDDAVEEADDDSEDGPVTRSRAGQTRRSASPDEGASSRGRVGRPRGRGRGRGRGRPPGSGRAARATRKRRRDLPEQSEDEEEPLRPRRRQRTVLSYLESDPEESEEELLQITGSDDGASETQQSDASEDEESYMPLRTRTRNAAESSSQASTDRKGKRKARSSTDSDDDFTETSSRARSSKGKGLARPPGRSVRGQLRDLDPDEIERHRPTEWITTTMRSLLKYHPQLGDRVAIMTEGHEQYWEKSAMTEYFDENHGPFGSKEPVEFAIVQSISWQVGPPAFCRLKLRIQRLENIQGALLEQEEPNWSNVRDVTIDYGDEDDCPEFLVLWERFVASMELFQSKHKLQVGQKVDAVYDDGEKYTGTITGTPERKAWRRAKMPSPWAYYHVIWDDDKSIPEDLSPWEVVRSGEDYRRRYDVGKTMTRQEIQRARDVLDWLKSMDDFQLYIDQVDYDVYTNYLSQIAYPICLDMVKARLNNKFYRQKEAMIDDVELIRKNAQKYNNEGSLANKNAVRLANFFKSRIENPRMPLSITKGRAKKAQIIESDDEYQEDEDPAAESEDSASHDNKRAILDDDEDEDDFVDDDDDEDFY